MNLSSILSPEAVLPRLDASSKKQALRIMAAQAEALTGLDADEIFDVLMEREHKSGTGVGSGAAIPQGRFEGLSRPYALFATLTRPVEFGAPDGQPVDLIFLLLIGGVAGTEHVKSMAVASRLLRDKKLCAAMRIATDAGALHALLTSREEDV